MRNRTKTGEQCVHPSMQWASVFCEEDVYPKASWVASLARSSESGGCLMGTSICALYRFLLLAAASAFSLHRFFCFMAVDSYMGGGVHDALRVLVILLF